MNEWMIYEAPCFFPKGVARWPEAGFEPAIFWLQSRRLNLSATELGRPPMYIHLLKPVTFTELEMWFNRSAYEIKTYFLLNSRLARSLYFILESFQYS